MKTILALLAGIALGAGAILFVQAVTAKPEVEHTTYVVELDGSKWLVVYDTHGNITHIESLATPIMER